ncbi:MAG: hypothetical protein Kapaf2KO_11370 [Candidatus Kapaibacteriales bacterium]
MTSSNIDNSFSRTESIRSEYLEKVRNQNQTEVKSKDADALDRLQTPRTSNLQIAASVNTPKSDQRDANIATEADGKGNYVDNTI